MNELPTANIGPYLPEEGSWHPEGEEGEKEERTIYWETKEITEALGSRRVGEKQEKEDKYEKQSSSSEVSKRHIGSEGSVDDASLTSRTKNFPFQRFIVNSSSCKGAQTARADPYRVGDNIPLDVGVAPLPINIDPHGDYDRHRVHGEHTFRFSEVMGENEEYKQLYQIWPGNNTFCWGGKYISGPNSDLKYYLLTWGLIISVAIAYFIIAAPFLWREVSIYLVLMSALLLLLTVVFLLLTTYSDPGVIPRKEVFLLFGNIPRRYTVTIRDIMQKKIQMEDKDAGTICSMYTLYIDVQEVNRRVQKMYKFCRTCKIFRPPRSSHCP